MKAKASYAFLWFFALVGIFPGVAGYGDGQGLFDDLGGTNAGQTGFDFEKTLFYEMRKRTLVGKLSRVGMGGAAQTSEMVAGGDETLNGSGLIVRRKMGPGNLVRFTLQEHLRGMPTYGDTAPRRGGYLAYKNNEVRTNEIDSPAFPIIGRMQQLLVAKSIENIPAAVREEAINYMAEQDEFEFLYSLYAGGSMSAMQTKANGGLALKLGVNALGTAGAALMPKNFYTPDSGWLTYSTTPATWNTAVNTALNAITKGANGRISLNKIRSIRSKLDDIPWRNAVLGGKTYKAIWLCDSDLWYRIDYLISEVDKLASPREKGTNPVFDVDHAREYLGFLFVNVPNMKKYRLAYNESNGYPDIGPGLTQDPRTFSTSSDISTPVIIGARATMEGYNDSLRVKNEVGPFEKGQEVMATRDLAYIRGEFYAEDGRTDVDAVYNDCVAVAGFYEDGVDAGY